jgi:hypothetical protein
MTAYELEKQTGDIFGNTYWGYAHGSAKLSPEKMSVIYRNRLDFYKEHELCRRWNDKSIYLIKRYGEPGSEQDHVEAYTANFGYSVVVICSNYNSTPHPFLMMREVAALYVPFAKTYAVTFPSKEAARAVLKAFPYVFEMTKSKESA